MDGLHVSKESHQIVQLSRLSSLEDLGEDGATLGRDNLMVVIPIESLHPGTLPSTALVEGYLEASVQGTPFTLQRLLQFLILFSFDT